MENDRWKNQGAFTLIELLVVVSIIGILTTLLFANLNTARERGRDAQRKSDIRNIQTALRLYYNDNVSYPTSNSDYEIVGCGPKTARTTCSWGETWSTSEGQTYMNVLPKEPQPDRSYKYEQTSSDSYVLRACFENKSDDKGKATTDTTWCPSGWMYEVKP